MSLSPAVISASTVAIVVACLVVLGVCAAIVVRILGSSKEHQ